MCSDGFVVSPREASQPAALCCVSQKLLGLKLLTHIHDEGPPTPFSTLAISIIIARPERFRRTDWIELYGRSDPFRLGRIAITYCFQWNFRAI